MQEKKEAHLIWHDVALVATCPLDEATFPPVTCSYTLSLMPRMVGRFWALAVLACLLGGQLHLCADVDPCLWFPAHTQRIPMQTPDHGRSGHSCLACLSGMWATTLAPLALAMNLSAVRLEIESPLLVGEPQLFEVCSPRAPPLG